MLAYQWPPSTGAGVWRPLKFAKYLSRLGWRPTVVTRAAQGVDGQGECEVRCETHRVGSWCDTALAETVADCLAPVLRGAGRRLDGVKQAVLWRLRRRCQFPDPATYANRWIGPFVRKAASLARSGRFAAVYVTSPPQSMVIVACLLERLCRVPVVLDFRDAWTQDFGYSYTGLRDRLARSLERAAVEGARRVICVTDLQVQWMQECYPRAAAKICCIANGFDPDDFRDLPSGDAQGRFVLTAMGVTYDDPASLVEAVRVAAATDDDFARCFTLRWIDAPAGLHDDALEAAGNLERLVRMDHRKALEHAARSSALWLEVPLAARAQYVMRSKTYEYLALQKPVLGTAPRDCAAWQLLSRVTQPRLVDTRDPQRVARLLREAFRDWRAGRLGGGVAPADLEAFRRDTQARQLAELLEACVRPGPPPGAPK